MGKFISTAKEHALRYAQIEKPKTYAEIDICIYTGLGPDWASIVLAQSERMLTMTTKELQSLMVSHEERQLYAAVQTTPSPAPSPAPLSGLLDPIPTEINYANSQGNQGGRGNWNGKENGKGGKGKGKWSSVRKSLAKGQTETLVSAPLRDSMT
ncbi:hypothetical protein CRG98_048387 [Punica granatum]|uniref:Uncharacterized protein n=1 Tax=Punica granatum TaxID=22663 RepID=A0A2I0HHL5_PUNGR|nr:hypothetical protein CRG98_048387 [Punica granatum]